LSVNGSEVTLCCSWRQPYEAGRFPSCRGRPPRAGVTATSYKSQSRPKSHSLRATVCSTPYFISLTWPGHDTRVDAAARGWGVNGLQTSLRVQGVGFGFNVGVEGMWRGKFATHNRVLVLLVWGLGFRGLGFRVYELGFRAKGFVFRIWGLKFGVQSLGFRVCGVGCCRVDGSGLKVEGSWHRV